MTLRTCDNYRIENIRYIDRRREEEDDKGKGECGAIPRNKHK